VWFLVRTAQPNWQALARVRVSITWEWLLLGSMVWLASFSALVRLWAASLAWWGQRLTVLPALRIFFLTNLARYIPGTIWQFTGLAAMALAHRVSPLAAAGGVLVQQIVLLTTGVVLSLVLAPGLLGPLAASLSPAAVLTMAAGAIALLMVLFPIALPRLQRLAERWFQRGFVLPTPPAGSFARYILGSILSWVGYGVAFWLFARAILAGQAPNILVAGTAFVASYVAGIIAVFAPAGLVVREAALVAALGGWIGTERALILAVAARLWLVSLEILGALVCIVVHGFRNTNTN